jgi:hypothetical protein
MRADDVRKWLTGRQFRPFRIYSTNGRRFDIGDASQVSIGGTTALISTTSLTGSLGPEVEVSLVHITHLEPIAPDKSPSSN